VIESGEFPESSSVVFTAGFADVAGAAQSSVDLGSATPFAVLAGTTVTNTGSSTISGDVGVSPGSAITGFPPGTVSNGTSYAADSVALAAKAGLTTAYLDAAGRTPFTVVASDIGGRTLVPGVYENASALHLTGTVTLNAEGDSNAVFIFQAGSSLITASSSAVALTGGAQACNVFWQVGSSATIGTGTSFVGTILALTSVSLQTGATVSGRVLARNGEVSLESNVITRPSCSTSVTTTTVPRGAPSTGFGGAATSSGNTLLWIGVASLGVGAALLGEAVRRGRSAAMLSRIINEW
jgi:hypothetical protein